MSRCLRWEACQAGLLWRQCADLQPLSEAAGHGDGFYDMKRQCHLPLSEFCGKERSQECSAVNSLKEASFVQVLYICLITDYFDIVRLFSTLKRG